MMIKRMKINTMSNIYKGIFFFYLIVILSTDIMGAQEDLKGQLEQYKIVLGQVTDTLKKSTEKLEARNAEIADLKVQLAMARVQAQGGQVAAGALAAKDAEIAAKDAQIADLTVQVAAARMMDPELQRLTEQLSQVKLPADLAENLVATLIRIGRMEEQIAQQGAGWVVKLPQRAVYQRT